MAGLASFARKHEFGDVLDDALDRLHEEMLDEVPARLAREVLRDAMGDISTFMHFDLVLVDGSTIVGRFLEGPARRLGAGQRTYLERMSVAAVRPYEVLAVRADEGIELRDVLANETLFVTERAGTHEILPGFGLGARVIAGKAGTLELEQPTHAFSQTELLQLTKDVRRQVKHLRRNRGSFEVTFRDVLHRELLAVVVHRAWLSRLLLQHRRPRLVLAGEPMMIARVLFDAVAPSRIAAALRGEPCVVEDDYRSWTWLEAPEPPARVLATIRIEGKRLVAEAFSEERAKRVRAFLERCLGDAARYRITELRDPMRALREQLGRREPGEGRTGEHDAPEEARALAAAQIAKHYAEWVDVPLPALDGRTPRQAARLWSLLPDLIALLRDMDVNSERARRSGDVVNAVDFTPLWETLGLTAQRRPGSLRRRGAAVCEQREGSGEAKGL
jgi:hypothetical protein